MCAPPQVVVNELVKGLNLYRKKQEEPEVRFIYELDNSTLKVRPPTLLPFVLPALSLHPPPFASLQVCNFEYDFSGSQNITVRGRDGLLVNKTVQPFERKVLLLFLFFCLSCMTERRVRVCVCVHVRVRVSAR